MRPPAIHFNMTVEEPQKDVKAAPRQFSVIWDSVGDKSIELGKTATDENKDRLLETIRRCYNVYKVIYLNIQLCIVQLCHRRRRNFQRAVWP